MTRANNLIIQRKVSREIFMKYLYSRSVANLGWQELSQEMDTFLGLVEDDAIEIYKEHGGREIDNLESYREVVFDSSYLMDVAKAVEENIEVIDDYINKYARNWTTDTMPAVDVAILRLAIAEIKFMFTVPEVVACDEAVNIAKKYCDDDAYKYINGILGGIMEA
nr:transcription antitermination factor NusB [uncultured Peptostreptococcus sp.]